MNLTKTTSFAHQLQVIERSKDQRYFGLFMEQGTGKTHVTIATIVHLYRTGKINGVLVLAPNGVHTNWSANELPTHCPLVEGQDMYTAVWRSNMGKKRLRQFLWVANETPDDKLAVLLANIEATRTETFIDALDTFTFRRFLLVVDESTIIKNPKAEQTKATFRIAKNAAYTRILTGTPITQSPMDLWAQCHVLDPIALPYTSFTAFKREFAIEETVYLGPNRPQFQKIIGYRNQDKLARLIESFTYRVMKKDCLDLPEKIYQTCYVELTPEQQRIYRDLTKTCLAMIEPGMVTVTTALTMMLRLHQVTLGYVPTDDGTMRQIEHNRIKVLKDRLEITQGKTIIFCRFTEDIKQVTAALEHPFVTYYGETGMAVRQASIEAFQNEPECRYFVATRAAARGLTLTAAENVIYYSQGFSLEDRLQSEDRAHRIGQRKNVIYTDLVAQGTIDERIIEALRAKQELANSVLSREQLVEILSLKEDTSPICRTKFFRMLSRRLVA